MTPTQPLLLAQATATQIPLRDQSVDCCVTSPPYFNLRRYADVAPSLWPAGRYAPVPGAEPIIVAAWEGCLGNEDTVSAYIWHLLLVLREIKRILKDSGAVWWVLGDSFSSGDRQGHRTRIGDKQQTNRGMNGTADPVRAPQPEGVAQGSLLGIPGLLHQAALADGWVVRNDVIYAKVSCMPESVRGWSWQQARCGCVNIKRDPSVTTTTYDTTSSRGSTAGRLAMLRQAARAVGEEYISGKDYDHPDPACPHCLGTGRLAEEVLRKGSWRHTRSHETILMLTKGMGYWANAEAVREAASSTSRPETSRNHYGTKSSVTGNHANGGTLGWNRPETGRNPRSVLTPQSASFDGPHYAVFPSSLIAPLLKATCPERCCPQCGAGWAPTITQETLTRPRPDGMETRPYFRTGGDDLRPPPNGHAGVKTTIHGLRPTCQCCQECDIMGIQPKLREKAHATQGSRSREGLDKSVSQEAICGGASVPASTRSLQTEVPENLRLLPPAISRTAQDITLLQSDLFHEMDVGQREGESFPSARNQQIYSEKCQRHSETNPPDDDGGASRETPATDRACPPYQRGQARQSSRKLGSADSSRACQAPHEAPQIHELKPYLAVSGVVLDPFVGSGTTIEVARALGRQGVGLDLSYHYLATIARERLGLAALDRWSGKAEPSPAQTYDDLPLFAH